VQCDEYERARFLNQALCGMWSYLDSTICNAIKECVEPAMQDNLPFPISGFTFEKLGFGDAPFQIRGIKHTSLFAGVSCAQYGRNLRQACNTRDAAAACFAVHARAHHASTPVLHAGAGEPMALSVEVEVAWVAQPDIVAKLMPSRRWMLSHMDIRPAMYVKVDHIAIEGRMRLVFPLQLTLPIFSGMSISFLHNPDVRFHQKMSRWPTRRCSRSECLREAHVNASM
jgi:hypothetical protein